LNYAIANRREWKDKGEDVVAEKLKKYSGLGLSCTGH
jgi:hypothetical protein